MGCRDVESTVQGYLERRSLHGSLIGEPPADSLRIVVVIPCHDEPDVLLPVRSLSKNEAPGCRVEIIVVVNSPEGACDSVRGQNRQSVEELRSFQGGADWLSLDVLEFPALPRKHAGVGLARKIGLDEGLRRLVGTGGAVSGVMVCLDADCEVDGNYLSALCRHFDSHPETPGCSIHFEHPLEGDLDPLIYEAVIGYELHLRCFVDAQRWAGLPYAFQTVGSSMAVRPWAYAAQGGMNRRKAGEDFYFLQKIIPLGGFTEVANTCVRPSPRISHRVPFGTGKAVGDVVMGERQGGMTYAWETYVEAKALAEKVPVFFDGGRRSVEAGMKDLHTGIAGFLEQQGFMAAIEEIRANTSGRRSFIERFYRWFDAFRFMKFAHHLRDGGHPPESVVQVGMTLAGQLGIDQEDNALNLLRGFRSFDRIERTTSGP